MDEWIQSNIQKLTSVDTLFVKKEGNVVKSTKALQASPEIVELDGFYEEDVEIFFVDSFTKHIIQLDIDKISEKGNTLFVPVSHSEMEIERSEKRFNLKDLSEPVYLTNIQSDYEIGASIEFNNSKIDKIVYVFKQALSKYFSFVDIYFFREIITSTRGKIIKEYGKPLFIADINNPKDEDSSMYGCIPANVYFKQLKSFDRKIAKDTVSDITVPLRFNNALTYGYIHVTAAKRTKTGILDQLNNIILKLNNQLMIAKIIERRKDKVLVTDLSIKGMGILFTNRKLVTLFKRNALLNFDLIFPGNNGYSTVSVCRNVGGAGQGKVKGGLEYVDASKELEVFIQSFLAGISH